MASADAIAFNPMTTAGLGGPLDRADLNVSRLKYNELPYVKELKYLNTTHRDHLVALLKIIDANSMGQWFGIHSAHRHERLPDGTIRFEEDTGIDKLSLTKAAPVEGVDLSNMHATAFKLIENEFVAVEFRVVINSINSIQSHIWWTKDQQIELMTTLPVTPEGVFKQLVEQGIIIGAMA